MKEALMASCWTPCAWVARRADGRDPRPAGRDPLTERLCAALGVIEASQIVTTLYSPEFDRARIASLAPEVLAACAEDPEVAQRLLVPAGGALADTVAAVARSLGWPSGVLPLATAGGFLLSATIMRGDDRRPDPKGLPGGRDARPRSRPRSGHPRRAWPVNRICRIDRGAQASSKRKKRNRKRAVHLARRARHSLTAIGLTCGAKCDRVSLFRRTRDRT